MLDAPVVVTAPSGNVGREVVRALCARGIPVRAAVRDPQKATMPAGVEVCQFDFQQPSTYQPAVAGARGLFLLRPTQISRVGETLVPVVSTAQRAGVRQCVFLSVEGAERQAWLPHRRVEKALQASAMSWTFLRPNHFMQNLLGPYRRAIASGRLALPAGQGRVSFVDCADLGEVAAMAFADPAAHSAKGYPLTGSEAVSFEEIAELISKVTGDSVLYQPIGPVAYLRGLRRAGADLPYAAILTALHLGVRRGSAAAVDPTLGRLLGRRPRTMAEFVEAHAQELGASQPSRTPAA